MHGAAGPRELEVVAGIDRSPPLRVTVPVGRLPPESTPTGIGQEWKVAGSCDTSCVADIGGRVHP